MKNKISTFLSIAIIAVLVGTSNAQARESYAGTGAIVGGITVGMATGIGAAALFGSCSFLDAGSQCKDSLVPSIGIEVGLVGAAIGAGFGALIGYAIPKHKKLSVVPILDPTPGNITAGANLSFKF